MIWSREAVKMSSDSECMDVKPILSVVSAMLSTFRASKRAQKSSHKPPLLKRFPTSGTLALPHKTTEKKSPSPALPPESPKSSVSPLPPATTKIETLPDQNDVIETKEDTVDSDEHEDEIVTKKIDPPKHPIHNKHSITLELDEYEEGASSIDDILMFCKDIIQTRTILLQNRFQIFYDDSHGSDVDNDIEFDDDDDDDDEEDEDEEVEEEEEEEDGLIEGGEEELEELEQNSECAGEIEIENKSEVGDKSEVENGAGDKIVAENGVGDKSDIVDEVVDKRVSEIAVDEERVKVGYAVTEAGRFINTEGPESTGATCSSEQYVKFNAVSFPEWVTAPRPPKPPMLDPESGRILSNQEESSRGFFEEDLCLVAAEKLEKIKRHYLFRNHAATLDNDLLDARVKLISQLESRFSQLSDIQDKILKEYLPKWQHEQQLLKNGTVTEDFVSLDLMQSWIERIIDNIRDIKKHIRDLQLALVEKPCPTFNLKKMNELDSSVDRLFHTLIMNTFVVEHQPPQVMKTNTRFTATVRFLCGNKLNIDTSPTVKAIILSESNARSVISHHKQLSEELPSNPQDINSTQDLFVRSVRRPPLEYRMKSETRFCPKASLEEYPFSALETQTYDRTFRRSGREDKHESWKLLRLDTITKFERFPDEAQLVELRSQSDRFRSRMTLLPDPPFKLSRSKRLRRKNQRSYDIMLDPSKSRKIGYNPNVPNRSKDFESSGEILNSNNILEYNEGAHHMVSQFRNMQLKKIKRTEKKGTESVMDEKFILLFFTEFKIFQDIIDPAAKKLAQCFKRIELSFHGLAFSLPVVVIVHGNQDPHAWATVTWHNAFATPDEILYQVPDRVTWRELSTVLSDKFKFYTGRGLTDENLRYLASTVCRDRCHSPDILVSWTQFAKENLPDRNFTFWEWFNSILKLTRDYLCDLWKAGKIAGFIGRRTSANLLLNPKNSDLLPIGTFIVRFSESELGAVSIAFVDYDHITAMTQSLKISDNGSNSSSPEQQDASSSMVVGPTFVAVHLNPFSSACLKTRGLADRIRDLKDLLYLYPNADKEDAFRDYYTPLPHVQEVVEPNGKFYLPTLLITTLATKYPDAPTSSGNPSPNSTSSASSDIITLDQSSTISDSQLSPDCDFSGDSMCSEMIPPTTTTSTTNSLLNHHSHLNHPIRSE